MKFKIIKNSIGINSQFILMMSLLNLGVTFLSFALGYFVYSWAIKIGFIDSQSLNSNEFYITSVDFIWLFLVLLTGFDSLEKGELE